LSGNEQHAAIGYRLAVGAYGFGGIRASDNLFHGSGFWFYTQISTHNDKAFALLSSGKK
jgi:hypothetical protein